MTALDRGEALSLPETTAELAGRLRDGIAAGFLMYASVEATMFAASFETCMLPLGPTPADPAFVRLERGAAGGGPRVPTIASRLIPDLRIAGTATERPGDVIVGDFTLTGTLPDGWALHLHTEFRCEVEEGLVTRYVVKNDPDEFQRFVTALGNPYAGRGVETAEVREETVR
ncbi:hypothetical protein PSU4_11990 [Pseudonocardia sulfidoxydans NBRC 16205]|uniref:SnoaL-like domain-containing protein n=1 Tax=Pseudonocardia sulfidoxydans NBRC 16205 TaxID=1223511 RepID=A0A511DBR9_9PSEU|nr:hypothetical protein [Pseudonocardia sulfidoxydans]GEL22245.1 hypothetical protein PSU4_11990 [Pseudonocardia sulfidoxydans NBRC 16205]